MNNKSPKEACKKISAKALFSSPNFYIALFPHIISLWLVFSGNLGYFYVFCIFYSELIIDVFIMSIAVLLMKDQQVQKMYKSELHKSLLAAWSLIGSLAFCLFLGVFAFVILITIGDKGISITDILTNNFVQISVGIYLAAKVINLIINTYKYNSCRQVYIDKGMSFVINLFTLILFVTPGFHLIWISKIIFNNSQLVAIIILFAVRAYIDASFAVMEKDIDASYNEQYGSLKIIEK